MLCFFRLFFIDTPFFQRFYFLKSYTCNISKSSLFLGIIYSRFRIRKSCLLICRHSISIYITATNAVTPSCHFIPTVAFYGIHSSTTTPPLSMQKFFLHCRGSRQVSVSAHPSDSLPAQNRMLKIPVSHHIFLPDMPCSTLYHTSP